MKSIQLPGKILTSFIILLIIFGWNISMPNPIDGQTPTSAVNNRRTTPLKLEDHFVEVENLKLHYIETGKGRPVVLIHGNAGSIQDFTFGTLAEMAGKYRTIAFDLPGHGSSERKEKSMPINEQASILHSALNGIGIKKPILVGHSWGGAVALAYGLQYPNEVAGLVLLAPAAYPDPEDQSRIAALLDVPVLGDLALAVAKPFVSEKILKSELETAFYPDKVPQDYLDAVKDEWLGNKQIKTYVFDEQELNQSLQELSKLYGNLHMPVVIVTGDSDRVVIPQQNAYLLHKTIPKSKLIILPNSGHQIPQTRPKAVLKAVKSGVAMANRFKSKPDTVKKRQANR